MRDAMRRSSGNGWRAAADVTVRPLMSGDELIWWRHSLCLTINRHCAEFWTDDEVSEHLNRVNEQVELPIEF